MRKYLAFIVIFTILSATSSFSQIDRKAIKKKSKRISSYRGGTIKFGKGQKYDYLSFAVNSMNYFGDLAPKSGAVSTDIGFTRPGFTLGWGRRLGPRYTLRAGFTFGTLRGDDFESAETGNENAIFRYTRNLHFRNRIKELSFIAMFDLYKSTQSYLGRVSVTPYAFLGAAVLHHNPKAQVPEADVHNGNAPFPNAGEWVELQPLGTEGQNSDKYDIDPYKLIQIAIPFGLGVRWALNSNVDLAFEIGFRFLFFDYLDDVSGLYPDLGTFTDPLARAMSDRSQEPNAVVSGDARDFVSIGAITTNQSYVGADGQTYTVFAGFGSDINSGNIRGGAGDNDIYVITSLKFSYIIGQNTRRAKFR